MSIKDFLKNTFKPKTSNKNAVLACLPRIQAGAKTAPSQRHFSKTYFSLVLLLLVVGFFGVVEKTGALLINPENVNSIYGVYNDPGRGGINGYRIFDTTTNGGQGDRVIIEGGAISTVENRFSGEKEYSTAGKEKNATEVLNQFQDTNSNSTKLINGGAGSLGSQNKGSAVSFVGNKDQVFVMREGKNGETIIAQIIYKDKNTGNVMLAELPVDDREGEFHGYVLGSNDANNLIKEVAVRSGSTSSDLAVTVNKNVSEEKYSGIFGLSEKYNPYSDKTISLEAAQAKQKSFSGSEGGECAITKLGNCFAQGAYYILSLFAFIAGGAAWLLDSIIKYSVINMKSNLESIGAINVGWRAIRDLINICFIFIILYIAISTILGMNGHGMKQSLAKVIIFGMLINFSMFFTKVIIDASNILTLQFYTSISRPNDQGLGASLMQAFQLPAIYGTAGFSTDTSKIKISEDEARNFAKRSEGTFVIFIMGIVMLVVATGVMLGGAWIFFQRFIALIFLLATSPIAFAGMILHQTEHQAKDWWHKLMSECVAAPAFMILLWLAFKAIEGVNNVTGLAASVVGIGKNDPSSGAADTLAKALSANVIFNFAIVTTLFSFALIAAKKAGASGADTALKISGGVNNFARSKIGGGLGRGLGRGVGRVAGGTYRVAGSRLSGLILNSGFGKYMEEKVIKGGFVGKKLSRATLGVLNQAKDAQIGGAKTDKTLTEERKVELENYLKSKHYSGESIAEVLKMGAEGDVIEQKAVDEIHHGLKTEQHAEALESGFLTETGKGSAKDRYYDKDGVGKMTMDSRAAIARVIQEGLPSHKKKVMDEFRKTGRSDIWDKLGAGQRRSVLENLTEKEAKELEAEGNTLRSMLAIMRREDRTGSENIFKSGKTPTVIKQFAGQSAVDGAVIINMHEAYKELVAADPNSNVAAQLKADFRARTQKDIETFNTDTSYAAEKNNAEFYNKNAHKYIGFDSAQPADMERKRLLDTAEKGKKEAEKIDDANKRATAVAGITIEVLKQVNTRTNVPPQPTTKKRKR